MTILDERQPAAWLIEDANTATARALFEEARRRRRRRRWAFGFGLTIALLVAGLIVFLDHPEGTATSPQKSGHGTPVAELSRPTMPPQMVVWSQTSPGTLSIEVISSRSGHVIRTLAVDDGLFRSTPQPAVSGLTGTVFFDDAIGGSSTPGPGAPSPREQIMSVPLAGGALAVVAQGHDPAVSPDGRLLAYQTFTDITEAPQAIVVHDLVTGATTTWQFATNAPEITNGLSWSPDSRSLAFQSETVVNQNWILSTRVIDLSSPNRSLDDTRPISLPLCPAPTPWASPGAGRDMLWAGFLSATEGIGTCHHAGLTPQDDWNQPIVVNLATGHVVERLPVIRGLTGGGPSSFEVDPSGHHLLFVGGGTGAGGLYRWTVSGRPPHAAGAPSLVKNSVGSATWVPSHS
jgi:hypothetical protein